MIAFIFRIPAPGIIIGLSLVIASVLYPGTAFSQSSDMQGFQRSEEAADKDEVLEKEAGNEARPDDRQPVDAYPAGEGPADITAADSTLEISDIARETMSINFLDVDIRKALSALAMEQGINIATAPDVSGKISVCLHRVTLEKALKAITLAGGLCYMKKGDLYYVYKPKEPVDPKAEHMQMRMFRLKFGEVKKIDEILSAIPGIRPVKFNEDNKTILVEDTPENIAKIQRVIRFWDIAPRQVLIEAKILEVVLTDDMSLGVNWRDILGDVVVETGGFSRTPLPTADPNPGGSLAAGVQGGGLFATIIKAAGTQQQLSVAIDALKSKTTVNALSTPKILAVHGKPARVQVGGQQGYRVTTVADGIATETIQFIDTGTILEITPYMDDDDNILLQVKPSIQSVDLGLNGIPTVSSREVDTWLMSRDGDTVFIGGLIQNTNTHERAMVPCLGSIPGLGVAFGNTSDTYRKTELVILISPKILETEREIENEIGREKTRKMEEKMDKDPPSEPEEILELLMRPGR